VPSGGPAATNQPRWDFWGNFMQSLIGNRPMASVAGNHEIESVRSCFPLSNGHRLARHCDTARIGTPLQRRASITRLMLFVRIFLG